MSGLHVVAALALTALSIAAGYRVGTRAHRPLAALAAAAAMLTLATGMLAHGAWEVGYRRAVYIVAAPAGAWLDRKVHLGVAACCFALAGALAAADREPPPRAVRTLWALASLCSLAALVAVVYVHARAPSATLN